MSAALVVMLLQVFFMGGMAGLAFAAAVDWLDSRRKRKKADR